MGKRKVAGIIIPTVDNSFFAGLAHYAECCLYEKGYRTMICSSANDAEKEKEYLRTLAGNGAEGILCVSGLSALEDGLLPEDFPFVWVDRHPSSGRPIPWVANDDRAAMEEAAEYLVEKGCRNILLMPGYLAEKSESPRVEGYRQALKKCGIEWNPKYILNRSGQGSSEKETEELVRGIIREGCPVDGIITSSDRAAFGAIAALRSVGLYVPEDVKLISFDNSPYSAMASPAITALDRKPKQLAEEACEILLAMMEGGEPPCMEKIVPVVLEKRDSTR